MSGCTPETCMCKHESNTEAVEQTLLSISVKGDNEWTRAKHGGKYTQEKLEFGDTF